MSVNVSCNFLQKYEKMTDGVIIVREFLFSGECFCRLFDGNNILPVADE